MVFRGKRVLLITAHPDDECMFFGPVIYHVLKEASSFSLLCLTNGNFCIFVLAFLFVHSIFFYLFIFFSQRELQQER